MSHFTDNLYLRREIQRLLNENQIIKSFLVEYRGPYDTGENIGGYNPLTPDEQSAYEAAKQKRKEEADKINAQKLQDMKLKGIPDSLKKFQKPGEDKDMSAEEYGQYITKLKSRAAKSAQDDATSKSRSAADIQADIESGKYKLNKFQKDMYELHGTKYIQKLAAGMARQEARKAGLEARKAAYSSDEMRAIKVPTGVFDIGTKERTPEFQAAENEMGKIGKMGADRFGAAQDETIRRNREEALRTSIGEKVRQQSRFISNQQQSIKAAGARERLAQKQREAPAQLQSAIEREKSAMEKLKAMEAAAKARREQESMQQFSDFFDQFGR
jgi:hypothetical protein